MEESGGDDRGRSDEVSLLVEELIQLLIKCSMVLPSVKQTLICSIWTGKPYNLEGHGLQDCLGLTPTEKNKIKDDPPYSLALKAKSNLIGKERDTMELQEEGFTMKEVKKVNKSNMKSENISNPDRKRSWKRIAPVATMNHRRGNNIMRKRKSSTEENGNCCTGILREDGAKRRKHEEIEVQCAVLSCVEFENMEQSDVSNIVRSAAANEQADQAQ
ncbi:hypothetical protein J1N35_014481 [Gossypium stocksii]|uniref:Uncharacterized protein n=1 Tax=Gossypium stocksii TaxID=47602 RepID=A0A9D3VUW0_9ROSI|nr:hypothetical protein J1N35_014481 [Gossypium stocksii]